METRIHHVHEPCSVLKYHPKILLQQPHETRSSVDKRWRLVILSIKSENVLRELDIIGNNGGEASEVYVEYYTGESTSEIIRTGGKWKANQRYESFMTRVNLFQSHVEGEVDCVNFGILKEKLYARIHEDSLVPFIHGFVLSVARV